MTARMSEAERWNLVLEAASKLIEAGGITGCTMSAVAEASGISRQRLYYYFANPESILMELWSRGQGPYLHGPDSPPPSNINVRSYLKGRIDNWLAMPVSAATIGLAGLIDAPGPQELGSKLNQLFWSNFEFSWIKPLESSGVPRDDLTSAVAVIHAGVVSLVLCVSQRRTSHRAAKATLMALIDSVVGDDWYIATGAPSA
jgi:AcrR family transcriptional regulator